MKDLNSSPGPGASSPAGHQNPAWRKIIVAGVIVALLAATWRFTPLSEIISADRISDLANDIGGLWWAPAVFIVAYTPAAAFMFPRQLITAFGLVAFGPVLTALYGMTGILLAALTMYFAGRKMKRETVRRIAGAKMDRVMEMFRKRGFLSVTAVNLLPVPPFGVGCLIAGAIQVSIRDFLLGTMVATLPGSVMTLLFGEQVQEAINDPSNVNYGILIFSAIFIVGAVCILRYVVTHSLEKDQ